MNNKEKILEEINKEIEDNKNSVNSFENIFKTLGGIKKVKNIQILS